MVLLYLVPLPRFGQRHDFSITLIPLHHLSTTSVLWKGQNWIHLFWRCSVWWVGLQHLLSQHLTLRLSLGKPNGLLLVWEYSKVDGYIELARHQKSQKYTCSTLRGFTSYVIMKQEKKAWPVAIICSEGFQRASSVIRLVLCPDLPPRPRFLKGLYFALISNLVISHGHS